VKLLDFGVSKFSALDAEMSMTRTGAVMGTPYYMSPEQAKGGAVDNRSDLYAIGVVLYQMVTGRVPFNASSFNELLFKIALESPEPIEQIVPDCPPAFIALINKGMARDPAHRFQSAPEFRAALQSWAQNAGRHAGTMPMHALPDMRAPHGSSPMLAGLANSGLSNSGLSNSGLSNSGLSNSGLSNSGLSQGDARGSHPHFQDSNPHLLNTGPEMRPGATQHMAPGTHPAQLHGHHGSPHHGSPHHGSPHHGSPQLASSQAALALTPSPRSGNRTGMLAAVAVVVLLAGGSFGAYFLTRSSPAAEDETAPASDPIASDHETPPSSKPEATPDPDPVPEPVATPEPSAEPSVAADAQPAPNPAPQAILPRPLAAPSPRPTPTPGPVTQPVPTPAPRPTGRTIEDKL
jgi:serine/threonine-protein kinase